MVRPEIEKSDLRDGIGGHPCRVVVPARDGRKRMRSLLLHAPVWPTEVLQC